MSTDNSIATVAAASPEATLAPVTETPELDSEGKPVEKEGKPEKTEAERERIRMQRGIDRRTRQLAEARVKNEELERRLQETLTRKPIEGSNDDEGDDSKPLSLTRKQIGELVKAEAEKLAQTLRTQSGELEHRQSVVSALAKTWGQEKFDEIASDLDDAFNGLRDASGKAKPATDAVFVADDPARVIEWLANPDNLDEAERISKLNAAHAGKEIAKLEARFAADDAKAKPKESKVPAPLESVKGRAPGSKELAHLSGEAFDKRRQEQIRQRR